jgi:hypothetical protein
MIYSQPGLLELYLRTYKEESHPEGYRGICFCERCRGAMVE